MRKFIATSAAALLALSPVVASAQSALVLESTKSTGNLNAGVGDDVVVVDQAPAPVVTSGGGLGTAGYVAIGAGALALAAIIAAGDDDDDNNSTTTTPN